MGINLKTAPTSLLSQWRWQRRGLVRSNARPSRLWKAIFCVVIILAVFHILDKSHKNRAELATKYTPTKFSRFSPIIETFLKDHSWQWDDPQPHNGLESHYSRKHSLAHRDEWGKLGRGFEGTTFQYQGNVIKVFNGDRAPLRNCLPGSESRLRWPTEIPASLILGGLTSGRMIQNSSGFLPVVDYYLSPSMNSQGEEWHLVTPFLPLGNLERLARQLKRSGVSYSARELDTIFRPSVESLFQTLSEMHLSSGLCHDDVKLDNIFLGFPGLEPDESKLELWMATNWLLGDLGNVRERGHPYHSSKLWMLSGNLPDCRANDVLRLLKVYMSFLRESIADPRVFEEEFLQDSQPWSRLFWSVWEDAQEGRDLSADSALELSKKTAYRPVDQPTKNEYVIHQPREFTSILRRVLAGNSIARYWEVKKILRISAGDSTTRRWGLVSLLGVPQGCCSVDTL